MRSRSGTDTRRAIGTRCLLRSTKFLSTKFDAFLGLPSTQTKYPVLRPRTRYLRLRLSSKRRVPIVLQRESGCAFQGGACFAISACEGILVSAALRASYVASIWLSSAKSRRTTKSPSAVVRCRYRPVAAGPMWLSAGDLRPNVGGEGRICVRSLVTSRPRGFRHGRGPT